MYCTQHCITWTSEAKQGYFFYEQMRCQLGLINTSKAFLPMYMWQDNSCTNVKLSSMETQDVHLHSFAFCLWLDETFLQLSVEAPDIPENNSFSGGSEGFGFHTGRKRKMFNAMLLCVGSELGWISINSEGEEVAEFKPWLQQPQPVTAFGIYLLKQAFLRRIIWESCLGQHQLTSSAQIETEKILNFTFRWHVHT